MNDFYIILVLLMSSAKCQMVKGKETHLCIVSLAMNLDPHGKKYYNLNPTYKSRTRFAVKELKYLIAHSYNQSSSQRKRVKKDIS